MSSPKRHHEGSPSMTEPQKASSSRSKDKTHATTMDDNSTPSEESLQLKKEHTRMVDSRHRGRDTSYSFGQISWASFSNLVFSTSGATGLQDQRIVVLACSSHAAILTLAPWVEPFAINHAIEFLVNLFKAKLHYAMPLGWVFYPYTRREGEGLDLPNDLAADWIRHMLENHVAEHVYVVEYEVDPLKRNGNGSVIFVERIMDREPVVYLDGVVVSPSGMDSRAEE